MRRPVLLAGLLAVAGAAVAGTLAGHVWLRTRAADQPTAGPVDSAGSESRLHHDCGSVIEGERVAREFEYVNTRDHTIRVLRDEDIRPNCGCSALTVSHRTLGPGEKTTICAVIETTGRPGKFTYGGSVTWHDDAGNPLPVEVAISGLVMPAIQVWADRLTFGAEEIRAGTAKEVTLTSRVQIDWEALSFDVSEPQLFSVTKVCAVENGVKYAVRCLLPPEVESASAVCRIRGQVADSSPTSPGLPVALDIPVRGSQSVELIAQPQTVLFQFDPAGSRYSGRVLLRGNAVKANPDLVESVTAAGCAIDWSVNRNPNGGTVVLELAVVRKAGEGWTPPTEMMVVTRQGHRLVLRAVWAGEG
jgi:hypothetical protein